MALSDTIIEILRNFPFPGLWENYFLLVALVGLRVAFYAITAREDTEHPHFRIGSILLYFMVLFFFGWIALLFILFIHNLRVRGRLKSIDSLADKLPEGFKDISSFTLITYLIIFLLYLPKGTLEFMEIIFPFPFLDRLPTEISFTLIAFAFLILAGKERENLKQDLLRISFGLLIFLGLLGIEFVIWYLAFVALRPLADYVWRKAKNEPQFQGHTIGEPYDKVPEHAGASSVAAIGHAISKGFSFFGKIKKMSEAKSPEAKAQEATVSEEEKRHKDVEKEEEEEHEYKSEEEKERHKHAMEEAAISKAERAKAERSLQEGVEGKKWPPHPYFKFIIPLLSDIADYFGGVIPILGDILDVVTGILLVWANGAVSTKNIILSLLPMLIEFIPGADVVPTYFIFWMLRLIIDKPLKEQGHRQLRAVPVLASVIIFIIIIFLVPAILDIPLNQVFALTQRVNLPDFAVEASKTTSRFSIDNLKSYWDRALGPILRPGYIAEVDRDINRDVGIKVNTRDIGSRKFWKDESATVSFDLSGELLNMKKCSVNETDPDCIIKTECSVKDFGRVSSDPIEVKAIDLLNRRALLHCIFNPDDTGVKEVKAKAVFDLETRSYQQFYAARLESIRRSYETGENLLDSYGYSIEIPKRTPGPVDVIWDFPNELKDPISLPESKEDLGLPIEFIIRLGENTRQGRIVQIKKLDLHVPKGFAIESCLPFNLKLSERAEEDALIYELSSPEAAGVSIRDFEDISCKMIMSKNSDEILFNEPAPSWFFIRADIVTRVEVEDSNVIRVESRESQEDFDRTKISASSFDICPSDVSVCSQYPSKELCDADPCNLNCVYYFGLVSSECGLCPAQGTVSCGAYINKEYCTLDPCKIGCFWEKSSNSCSNLEIGRSFEWPSSDNQITACDGNKIMLSAKDRIIRSIASGEIAVVDKGNLEVKHGNAYVSHFKGLERFSRTLGNVRKGETIAISGLEPIFYVTKDGEEINLFELYANSINSFFPLLEGDIECPARYYNVQNQSIS